MNRIFRWILLVLLAHPIVGLADEGALPIERWDRAVCLMEQKQTDTGNPSGEAGSGFLVTANGKIVLVTAGHVARFTSRHSKLLVRNSAGETRWVILAGLSTATGDPWNHHPSADLAIMLLSLEKLDPKTAQAITELALPDTVITDTPRRTSAIEITGFPLLLGVTPSISPLVMRGHLASRQMEIDAKWGKEQVLFAFPVVGDGTSGGPVFLADEDSTAAQIIAMYVGYHSDKTGPKLAKLVPGALIAEQIKQLTATVSPATE